MIGSDAISSHLKFCVVTLIAVYCPVRSEISSIPLWLASATPDVVAASITVTSSVPVKLVSSGPKFPTAVRIAVIWALISSRLACSSAKTWLAVSAALVALAAD